MSTAADRKKANRDSYPPRKILLRAELQRETAIAAIRNAPLDDAQPLELLIREAPKARKLDQNAAYWAGPLRDIAEQGWIAGRKFSADVLHEHFKREYLPEDFDPILCREGYRKWAYMPNGERTLVGSTTQLTVAGFAQFLTQVEAFGAELGVQFHANPNERQPWGRAA